MNWNGKNSSTKVSRIPLKKNKQITFNMSLISFEILFVYFSALLLFGNKITGQSIVYLTDNTGTDIPQNLFVQIIKNFWNGSNFYVEIKYTPTKDNNNQLVTPEVRNVFLFKLFYIFCSSLTSIYQNDWFDSFHL